MSLEKFIEEQISRAMAEGEFDNLPGKGKPVDLEGYFEAPEDVRMGYSILKNAACVPEEVELRREIAALREALSSATEERERARLNKTLNERLLALNLARERFRRVR